jgi:predicted permease
MIAKPSLAERLFSALLRVYPSAFRRQFGRDMTEFFRDRLRHERKQHGLVGVFALWVRVIADAGTTSALEHADAIRERLASRTETKNHAQDSPSDLQYTSTTNSDITYTNAHHSVRRGDSMLQSILQDLRYTVRGLRRNPVFTIVAVVVIALGTGAITTIYSAANSLVLRPLPGTTNPGELMEVHRTGKGGLGSATTSASYPYYKTLRDRTHTLSGLAAWGMAQLTISTGAESSTSLGNIVSGNYFDVMGVRPALGRFFLADEDSIPGAKAVVVLSHSFWLRRFAGDSTVLGRIVYLNNHAFTVIGVAARGFHGVYAPLNTDAWVPMMMQEVVRPERVSLSESNSSWLELVGRARQGVSQVAIATELSSITESIARESENAFYQKMSGVRVATLFGLPTESKGAIFSFTALLLTISALVLIIACANVGGMLLARATTRRREMALRVALGAARGRLIRQLMTESVLLFLAGGVGGIAIATLGAKALERVPLPAEFPIAIELAPDVRVLLFALGVSLLAGIVFGFAPAIAAARHDVASQLRSDTAGSGARRSRARSVLVVGQLAVSFVLLVSAGLFLRAFDRGLRVDPGFSTENVSVAAFDASTYGYTEAQGRAFYATLKTRLQTRPGVDQVSFAHVLPLSGNTSSDEYQIDGYTPTPDEAVRGVSVNNSEVGPEYFSALQIPMVRGRAFSDADQPGRERVVIVNEAFAKKYWSNTDAVGRSLREDTLSYTVVGVVRNSKFSSLGEPDQPFLYLPIAQSWSNAQNLIVHSTLTHSALSVLIRDEVRSLDARVPAPQLSTLKDASSISLLPQRLAALITGALGALGLVLAAVGLYGIVAFSVSQRTREIGVRIALGATASNVTGMIVREGMSLVLVGISIGLVLAFAATRALSSFLFGVSATDAITFVAIPVLLALVAGIASYVPARKAASTDPLNALRAD